MGQAVDLPGLQTGVLGLATCLLSGLTEHEVSQMGDELDESLNFPRDIRRIAPTILSG